MATSGLHGSRCACSWKSIVGVWNAPPSIDDAELAMLAIAAGDWDHEQMAAWLADRISPSEAP